MKSIKEKLRAMGLDRATAACVIHAERMITYDRQGNEHLFARHSELLDQCVAVGRELKYGKPTECAYTARQALEATP